MSCFDRPASPGAHWSESRGARRWMALAALGCALWLVPGAVRAQDATPAPTPPADAKDADSKIELSGSIDGYYGYN
ncbi:MAG TPA: hypothetical protein VGN26_04720, partial [Armatimonadota bacterium]